MKKALIVLIVLAGCQATPANVQAYSDLGAALAQPIAEKVTAETKIALAPVASLVAAKAQEEIAKDVEDGSLDFSTIIYVIIAGFLGLLAPSPGQAKRIKEMTALLPRNAS